MWQVCLLAIQVRWRSDNKVLLTAVLQYIYGIMNCYNYKIIKKLTGLSSPGAPSEAWAASIFTRTWQDLENFALRIASGTLQKKNKMQLNTNQLKTETIILYNWEPVTLFKVTYTVPFNNQTQQECYCCNSFNFICRFKSCHLMIKKQKL